MHLYTLVFVILLISGLFLIWGAANQDPCIPGEPGCYYLACNRVLYLVGTTEKKPVN